MNFFIMVSLFLSAALGVFRGIDLALLTDAETGLCIVGSVWLRRAAGPLHAFRRRGTGGGCLLW